MTTARDMAQRDFPYYLAGEAVAAKSKLEVRDPESGGVFARVGMGDAGVIDRAIGAAAEAAGALRRLPTYRRRDALLHVAARIGERREEFARVLAVEARKPISDARGEVARCVDTFRTAAELTGKLHGEHMALDISERAAGYEGVWKRVPIGVCGFITPFNFPLNLAAHKVAPAVAVGAPFVLKPASNTPLSALLLAELLAETNLPPGAFSVIPCGNEDARALVEDERINLLSFTGSQKVGWDMKARAGRKRVLLELGGAAPCIVDEGADLEFAADRITTGAFGYAGQSCISVQRVLIHERVYDQMKGMLVERARGLRTGPLMDEGTKLGPMISEDAAKRVEEWVNEAVQSGARALAGAKREGALHHATLLENVDPEAKVSCEEVFGPVAVLRPFSTFGEAVRMANDSRYGLQAGVFTRDLDRALAAFDELEYGGVVINDIPSMRVDNMPYGGVKESGLGREGVRFAMEEMTEIRLMVLRRGERGL